MTRQELLRDLVERLGVEFRGYALPNRLGLMQEVRIHSQYLPQPQGVTFGNTGVNNYTADDYDANFPCIVVKLEDLTDNEQNARPHSMLKVRILCGIYDASSECQGYADILNMQEKIRAYLLEHRVIARKYVLKMPLVTRLIETETWPVFYGEMELVYQIGRPMMDSRYVYGSCENLPRT